MILSSIVLICSMTNVIKNLYCGGSYIDSPDWIKNKKATINFINYNDKSFQLARTVALNHKEIGKNYKYNWEEISYLL